MKTRNGQKIVYSLIILLNLIILSSSYSCQYGLGLNWFAGPAWDRCYQASDGNIIGYSQGSLSSGSWGGGYANMDYDYNNNIAFIQSSAQAWQYWDYNYHYDTCCVNDLNADYCSCYSGYNCYSASWTSGDWPYCHNRQWRQYDSQILTVVWVPCHPYCSSCSSSWSHVQCNSCWNRNGNAYQWLSWGSSTAYISTCHSYCPNDADRGYDNAYPGQYISVYGNNYCAQCNLACSICADVQGGLVCSVCVSTAYLIQNYALCTSTFQNDPYCQADNQCVFTQCPTNLYFELPRSQTTNPVYQFTYYGASNLRLTNVCYLCHRYCLTCTDQYDYKCSSCAYSYYKMQQYGTRCNYYCREGDSYTGGSALGEYVISTSNRQCGICATGCKFCAYAAAQCYICQDTHFLVDNRATCLSTFTCKECTSPAVTDGCQATDNICRVTNCPAYFYFRVNRTSTGNINDGPTNNLYTQYTMGAAINPSVNGYEQGTTRASNSSWISPQGVNPNYNYRQFTNLCMLCDYRCIKCFGPSNLNCTLCANNYYKWTNATVCSSLCPIGQFQLNISASYPDNQTKCENCDPHCVACVGYNNNCTKCTAFPNAYYAFLNTYYPMNSTCLTTCATSSNQLTAKGYYGSIATMICYACPGQCSDCNIDQVRDLTNYPELQPIVCGTDNYCTKGIQCTACLSGYTLISGQCYSQQTCKLYSYYQKGANSTSTWSPTNCKCADGYYLSGTITCSACDITCLTCSGSSSSNCLSCSQGYKLQSNTCQATNTGSQVYTNYYWASNYGFNAYISTGQSTDMHSCGSYYTLFGYKSSVSTSSYYKYSTNNLGSPNYYGISFKLRILFIDNWDSTAGIYFKLDSNSNPSFIYTYNNFGAIGEQQCGTNAQDYILTVSGQISVIPTGWNQAHTISVYPNMNPVWNTTGFYYYWGIQSAYFTVLSCHSDCSTCTGPAANQCTACSDSMKTAINGSCVCNVNLNYYYVNGSTTTCQTGCAYCNSSTSPNSCFYRDALTATCAYPPYKNCSAPNLYGNTYDIYNYYGTCVQNCSSGYYAIPSLMKCTTACHNFGFFSYKGATTLGVTMWTCVSVCPSGLMLDLTTVSCVTACPYYSGNTTRYFLQLENRTSNPICVSKCSTGYEYDNENMCVVSCPSGYYTQTLNGHNKCVQTCSNAFGDNVTLSCVVFCPTPSIADPTKMLCVNECSTGYYFQISIANGNRSCVTKCQAGQWLHPYYLNCSTNPLNCPVGTYADNQTQVCEFQCHIYGQVGQNTTRMCQTYCNTGYAYWDVGLCVQICNNTMFGYKDNTTSQCRLSCDSNNTAMYGDVQAKRTCVKNCSYQPDATFGDNMTGLCVKQCPVSNQYGDPYNAYRLCVPVCTSFPNQTYSFYLTKLCVAVCPVSYYGDNYTTTGVGICSTSCPSGYYGNPLTNLCVSLCPYRYYGSQINGRICVQTCPYGYYAINLTSNRVCTSVFDQGYWADNYTRMCYNTKTSCSNNTYADASKKLCVTGTNCTVTTYADPLTMGCETKCNSSSYFGDPSTNLCVTLCPTVPDYYSQGGYCTGSCTGGYFADYQSNRTCLAKCTSSPISLYGNSLYRCVEAKLCGAPLFGNNNTRLCSTCSGTLPFGDPISFQCVIVCPLTYYGDPVTNLCVQQCDFSIFYYADNATGNCTTMCTLGTFGVNATFAPVCQSSCPPNSYALDTNRVCMQNCGTGYFGDPLTGKCYNSSLNCSAGYFGNKVTNMCVTPTYCQTVAGLHYYADNKTKMCILKCTTPNYGVNTTWYCVSNCPNPYYAQNTTRVCLVVSGCSLYLSFADSQLNVCVSQCSASPVFTYSENITYTCVIPTKCPNSMLAENSTQSCVSYCPHNSTYFSFADPYVSNRCVARCPDEYYGDTSSGHGLCASECPGNNYFRDNSTQLCVYVCPTANSTLGTSNTYGDNTTDMCASQCPPNYFAQVGINRTCVQVCMPATWGNVITRMCINNPVTNCPTGTWGDNFTNLCTNFCNSNSSNSQLFYGENITRLCIPSCPVPTFAFIQTRVCIDICPLTITNSPGYFGDPGTTPTRLCVTACLTGGLYRDVANNRTCQPTCTYNSSYKTYQNPTTMTCVAQCPTYPQFLYAWATNSSNAACLSSCPTGYMNEANMSCVSACPNLLDPTTNHCVSICPENTIANTTLYANLVSQTCVPAASCPNNTYASDDSLTCVSKCPNNTYIYQKNCVYFCPAGYYINFATQTCVTASGCPTNYFANNQTTSCVASCTNGTFGDSSTRMCITTCYDTNYADPLTGLCSSSCSIGLIKNSLTFSCVSNCSTGYFFNPANSSCNTSCPSPYFADTKSASCVSVCSSNPMTFASITPVRACVTTCPSTAQWFDLVNRVCTATCPSGTYQYSYNSSCVSFCPTPYYTLSSQSACVLNCTFNGTTGMYADDTTRTCVQTCPSGYFKDNTIYKCVLNCPINPVRYYASTGTKTCLTSCPSNTYADNQKGACVTQCSIIPMLFADPNSWKCVSSCPASNSSFADPTTQKCVTRCPTGYYADNRQRSCLSNCSNIYFADSQTSPPACVSQCTSGTFADPLLFKCVTSCSPTYYSFSLNGTCLQYCPYTYFADNYSKSCVQQCKNSPNYYADNLTHTCTSICSSNQFNYKQSTQPYGFCVYYCPNGYFSDPTTMFCVTKCPQGYFGNTNNNTCNLGCEQNQFMDGVNNLCQNTCPSANLLFGEPFSRTCVTTCNSTGYSFLYADSGSSLCVQVCSGNQFADPSTLKCVANISCASGTNADPYYKKCVNRCYNETFAYEGVCYSICPSASLFADEQSQSCVAAANCASGLFADPSKGKCVSFCDIASNAYADISSNTCLTSCNSPLYADNITRTCAKTCPSVPLYYGFNTSRICVQYCPPHTFGDPTLNLCVSKCSSGYYGDSTTWTCLTQCPFGTFGDNSTNLCVATCPSGMKYFGDVFTGTCVLYCSHKLYADTANNRECQPTCLSPTYSQNSTMQCVSFCLTGFADIRTGRCIANCTKGYYGFNFICYLDQCPSANPLVYADDSINLCVKKCPNGTFGELNTRKCVNICPISYNQYADLTNKVCLTVCPSNTNADSSTRNCVGTCPSTPALFSQNGICVQICTNGLFADILTRSCVSTCSNGIYADSTTYTCVSSCPTKPMLYADNLTKSCISGCSVTYDRYADNSSRSCVIYCPNNTFADSTTRSCKPTCSAGYYGVNSTWRCEIGCTSPTFADKLIRLCVTQCSIDPLFYGDPLKSTCVSKCPSNAYGNPLTQQCVYNNGSVSTCPDQYFADSTTQLCVQVCPMKQDIYAEPNTKSCKSGCVSPYIADNSTMRCVLLCPSYPNYYANLNTGRCVKYCPANTYADNSTRVCVTKCPNGTYAQNSTWNCVSYCLNKPMTLRDPVNWKCVTLCPPNYFADSLNLLCIPHCLQSENSFAKNDTRQCVKSCPIGTYAFTPTRTCVAKCYNNTYADNSTLSCVQICPRSPPLFAYNITMTCVPTCPPGIFAFDDTRQCLYDCPTGFYRQNSSNSCVRSCNITEKSYRDNFTGYCVTRCSWESYADPTTKACVSICPNQPLMYSENSTQSCLSSCINNLYGENNTRSCVVKCPNGSLSLPQLHLCVFECPVGYYAYLVTQFCYQVCPDPFYGDPSTRTCVASCPINQLLYADNSSRTCVKTCPSGSYAYQWAVACLPSCPIAVAPYVQTYAADYDHTCVEQCAYPFYSYDATHKCVSSCPKPYYNSLQTHKCIKCTVTCSSCTGETTCTSCFSGYFLQSGLCVTNCTLIYYANSNTGSCVTSNSCAPNFGENSTRQCLSSCAVGSFKNYNAFRCDACPSTCVSCTSLTNCLSCITLSVNYNNYCFGYCNMTNSTQRYFSSDNKTCTSTCPNGTYASVVYCKLCSSQCSSCIISAKNCTNCSGGKYIYNYGCVSSCPANYKPNVDRLCVYCNNTCGSGLTMSSNVTSINGQTSLFVNFNNPVSLNANLYSTFRVVAGSRLLQSSSSSPGYQIVVVDSQTVQIVFPPGTTNTNYNVQIADPQSIVDANGNLPSSLSTSVQIASTDLYSSSISSAPDSFPLFFTFLAVICIITFIFDIELMKFLQLIYVHYFIVINLPPEFIKVFSALRYSTLYYLPNIFPVEEAILRPNVPTSIYNTVGDYNFLRNAGFAFTPLALILLVWGLLKVLSMPEINRFKDGRIWCSKMLQEKFRYSVFLEWVGIFLMNTVFFAFLQLRDYNIYDTFAQVSLILAHAFIAFFIIVSILVAYRVLSFYQEYPVLSESLKKAADLILQDNEADNLVSTNIFLSQKKKIDMRNMYYPKINNENIFPFKCIYRYNVLSLLCSNVLYLRAIVLSAIIALAKKSAQLQMGLCIPLNILVLLYFCKARPYTFKFNHFRIKNYFAIFHEASIIIFELLLLILGMQDQNNATPTEKENFSYYIIYYLVIVCSFSFVYHIFSLVVFLHRKIWLRFIESELFKRNFPKKYAEYQAAKNKSTKLVKSIDPKAKEALKSMIKGYKKSKSVLRPTDNEKDNSKLPVKYKITYFDRTQTSSMNSRTTLSKAQKKKMIKEIFNQNEKLEEIEKDAEQYEQINDKSEANEFQYEQYEEEIEIKAKDLSKYIANAENYLKTKKDDEMSNQ